MHSASVTRPTDRLSRGRCASVTRPTDRLWDERAAARPSEEKKPPRPPASRHQLPPSPSAQQRRRATPSASSRRRRWLQLLRRSSMRTGPSFEAMAVAAFPRRGPVFGLRRPRSRRVLKREFSSKHKRLQPYLPYMDNGGAYSHQPASARARARDKYRTKHATCIRRESPFDLRMPRRTRAQGAQRA